MMAFNVSEKYLNNMFCFSTCIPKIRLRNLDMSLWPLSRVNMPGMSSEFVINPTPTNPSAMSANHGSNRAHFFKIKYTYL